MPATNRNLGFTILELIESSARTYRAAPLNLGGLPGEAGGDGAPPGGYIGWLPQTRVAYDYTELASSGIPASGVSLLDNLNHIRYRLNILESGGSITVVDDNTPDTYPDTTAIHFSGAGVTVTDLGLGEVRVTITATGSGGGTPLVVEDFDGSPSVTNVDKIIFSGFVVNDLGSGDALVSMSGIILDSVPYNLHLYTDGANSDISGYETLVTIYPPQSAVSSPVTSVTANDTLLEEFVALPGLFNAITSQTARVIIPFGKTGGTKGLVGHVKLYHRTSGGTETLIGSSSVSQEIPLSGVHLRTFHFLVSNKAFSSTDRLVLKVLANPTGSGTDPSAAINIGVSTDFSGVSLGVTFFPIQSETQSSDVFRVDNPGGVSLWTGTISGTPSGASVTVSAPTSGTEAVLVPTSTSQLGKMRLYNLTRGNYALILNYNTGTNVVTLTENAPANWANADSLTIVSQTVSGGGFNWIDIEITSGPIGRSALFFIYAITSATGSDAVRIHPFETFATSKIVGALLATATNGFGLFKMVNNVFSTSWTGSPTAVLMREAGYVV